jgi:hypothetical protein
MTLVRANPVSCTVDKRRTTKAKCWLNEGGGGDQANKTRRLLVNLWHELSSVSIQTTTNARSINQVSRQPQVEDHALATPPFVDQVTAWISEAENENLRHSTQSDSSNNISRLQILLITLSIFEITYSNRRLFILHIVTCIPIARQRLGKHIPATQEQATIGYPLLCNRPVNTHFWQ